MKKKSGYKIIFHGTKSLTHSSSCGGLIFMSSLNVDRKKDVNKRGEAMGAIAPFTEKYRNQKRSINSNVLKSLERVLNTSRTVLQSRKQFFAVL